MRLKARPGKFSVAKKYSLLIKRCFLQIMKISQTIQEPYKKPRQDAEKPLLRNAGGAACLAPGAVVWPRLSAELSMLLMVKKIRHTASVHGISYSAIFSA